MVSALQRILLILTLLLFGGGAWAISTGTGFFFASNGYIATNYHVVVGGKEIVVRDLAGKIYEATVVATDKANDLAILKVDGLDFTYLPIRQSSLVRKGESVYTLGFPNIGMQGLEGKVTDGIVSSLSGLQGEPNAFQISVPIQSGNSGGPLFDKSGAVVGIVVSKLSLEAALKAGASLPENVNFAVKSNYLSELIRTVRAPLKYKESGKKAGAVDFPDIVERVERATVLVAVSSTADQSARAKSEAGRAAQPEPRGSPPSSGKKTIGEQCAASLECVGDGVMCRNGHCESTIQRPSGIGGACQRHSECVDPLFCINGRCDKVPSPAANYDYGSEYVSNYPACSSLLKCPVGGVCASSRCYVPASKSIGQRCLFSPECRGEGVFCRNEVCR